MEKHATGVLLLNMGGPDCLDDVAPFLYNLFSDREIIRLGPAVLQKPLAWWIARKRAPKSREIYSRIGGSSPLKTISLAQAKALEAALAGDGDFLVRVAMRYWQPLADEAVADLVNRGVETIIALPLYPHYSKATSGSSLRDLRRALQQTAPQVRLIEIASWPDQQHYVAALAEKIRQGAGHFGHEPFQLVYSAHSLPVSFIKNGDPYVEEIGRTIAALELQTGILGRLCYQSRSGPVEWLSPATSEMLAALAKEGCRNILMVPISFVSDHVETLYEIGMLFRDQAAALGMRLEATESLNIDPLFIAGLRELVVATA
jgi:ferrochelatase